MWSYAFHDKSLFMAQPAAALNGEHGAVADATSTAQPPLEAGKLDAPRFSGWINTSVKKDGPPELGAWFKSWLLAHVAGRLSAAGCRVKQITENFLTQVLAHGKVSAYDITRNLPRAC